MADAFDSLFNSTAGAIFAPGSLLQAGLRLFLVLYGALAAPSLPPMMAQLFDIPLFRLAIMMLIVWVGGTDPTSSLLLAVAFLASVNFLQGKKFFEKFAGTQ